MNKQKEIKVNDARPGKFNIAAVSIPIGCGRFQKRLVVNGNIRKTRKNGNFVIDNANQVVCGSSAKISFDIALVKNERHREFKNGIFEIYLDSGRKIIKIIENGYICCTKFGNVVFKKNTETALIMVCGESARIINIA